MLENISVTTLVIVIISLLISMTFHEAMHAFTSHWLGDDTAEKMGRISLNPLKHVDIFTTILLPIITLIIAGVPLLAAKPVPFNPNRVKFDEFGAALVGVSGPVTNFVLAAAAAGILNIFKGGLGVDVIEILVVFITINVALFVFNMIPIPPLDGSRVLYAFAPEPVQEFMASLEQFGVFIIFALVLFVPGTQDILVGLNQSVFHFLVQ